MDDRPNEEPPTCLIHERGICSPERLPRAAAKQLLVDRRADSCSVPSRDAGISRFRRTLIGPCTTTIRGIQSEVLLEPATIPWTSVVDLDSVESVSLGVLVERLGRLSDEGMRRICNALEIAAACAA